MNSWNSGLIVDRNSLLKNKSLTFPSNSLLQSKIKKKKQKDCGC